MNEATTKFTSHKLPRRVSALSRELVRKIRQIGILGTAVHIGSKAINRAKRMICGNQEKIDLFDATYGTDTNGIIGVGSLDIPPDQLEHSMHYGPIDGEEFQKTLNDLPIDFEKLIFVDVGSGKGRMLLLASLFPFKRIIGVELSEVLHDTAVNNIQIFKNSNQRCCRIEAVNKNAAIFEIPGEPALFFLANPFDDHVMNLFVSNMRNSLEVNPREIFILYIKPCYRKTLDSAEFLSIIRDTGRYVLYMNQTIATP